MRRPSRTLRTLTLLAAAAISAAVAVASPAHADAIVTQPFAADSGDTCRFGVTTGTLTWIARGPLPVTVVSVAGSLTDRPLPTDPSTACRDPRYSSATFTAYRGTAVVDREQVRVDNGQLTFRFDLTSTLTVITPIDRVVVQVCRHAPPGMFLPDYCGKAVEYRLPIQTA
jgi:hypothetical protein